MTKPSKGNITYVAADMQAAIEAELQAWQSTDKIQRLWGSDPRLWTDSDEAKWTGWLTIPESEMSEIPRIKALADTLKTEGFQHIVLLGMGGSSLCPAMMTETFDPAVGYPTLHVLDSTDPAQIQTLAAQLDLTKSFFIVSTKSGSTLEPNIFKAYFYEQVQKALGKDAVGDRFLTVTDPGSQLETIAKQDQFREIFYGVPSIGGRYSALSNFGMVPSGLMGIDLADFLSHAKTMAEACAETADIHHNPGALLGVILGVCANHGKDKVTLIASPGIHALGAWLEQLLAESTGKIGKGLIPIDQEPLGDPSVYDQDRVFTYVRLSNGANSKQDAAVEALEKAGHVVVRMNLSDKSHLGAELFRWEFATAVAGSIIGINAFNQPDVEASKIRAKELTTEYEKTGKISEPTPFYTEGDLALFSDEHNVFDLKQLADNEESLLAYLKAHLSRIQPNDYVDLAAFIEMNTEHTDSLQEMREIIRDQKHCATCLGFGPRFLHSTGQAYKGGPNTGIFLQITADHPKDLAIPGKQFTFGLVITAQAQGDFEVLSQRSRRALRIHLGKDVKAGLKKLQALIKQALSA